MARNFIGIVSGRWKNASDLHVPARIVRYKVSDFNNRFGTDEKHSDYILSGQKGYRMTKDLDEIQEAIDRDRCHAIKRLQEINERQHNLDHVKNEIRHGRRDK